MLCSIWAEKRNGDEWKANYLLTANDAEVAS